jgi:hypothetical protein
MNAESAAELSREELIALVAALRAHIAELERRLVWKRDGDHHVGAGGSLGRYRICEWRMRSGSEWVTSSSRGLVGHFGSLTDAKLPLPITTKATELRTRGNKALKGAGVSLGCGNQAGGNTASSRGWLAGMRSAGGCAGCRARSGDFRDTGGRHNYAPCNRRGPHRTWHSNSAWAQVLVRPASARLTEPSGSAGGSRRRGICTGLP